MGKEKCYGEDGILRGPSVQRKQVVAIVDLDEIGMVHGCKDFCDRGTYVWTHWAMGFFGLEL